MDYGSVVKNKTKKSPGKLTLLEKKFCDMCQLNPDSLKLHAQPAGSCTEECAPYW